MTTLTATGTLEDFLPRFENEDEETLRMLAVFAEEELADYLNREMGWRLNLEDFGMGESLSIEELNPYALEILLYSIASSLLEVPRVRMNDRKSKTKRTMQRS